MAKIVVVHTDAVVRADLTDALQNARPSVATLSFADMESLSAHLLGAEPADLLLFDARFRLPEPMLSMVRCAVPMVFNPTDAETPDKPCCAACAPLPIPVRDEALLALLNRLFGA
jgi:hypothetical protein